jgi:hypothetical protein
MMQSRVGKKRGRGKAGREEKEKAKEKERKKKENNIHAEVFEAPASVSDECAQVELRGA